MPQPVPRYPSGIAELLAELGLDAGNPRPWFPGMSVPFAQQLRRSERTNDVVAEVLERRAAAWRAISMPASDAWRRRAAGAHAAASVSTSCSRRGRARKAANPAATPAPAKPTPAPADPRA